MFNVYSSVWFSAIYLLLFISLLGCIIPRLAALPAGLAGAAAEGAAQPGQALGVRHLGERRLRRATRWSGPARCCVVSADGSRSTPRRTASGRWRHGRASAPRRATCARRATWSSTSRCWSCSSGFAVTGLFGYKGSVGRHRRAGLLEHAHPVRRLHPWRPLRHRLDLSAVLVHREAVPRGLQGVRRGSRDAAALRRRPLGQRPSRAPRRTTTTSRSTTRCRSAGCRCSWSGHGYAPDHHGARRQRQRRVPTDR